MLYQITVVYEGLDGFLEDSGVTVEAPAHCKGKLPRTLLDWHQKTFLPQFSNVTGWRIAEYHPTRIGYPGANSFGVSELGRSIVLMSRGVY